ncbi:MAG: hypothetical protein IJT70_02420, partial [Clostridia bacterium]|nr:hypothetical protein [Clostridia bacterium]
WYIDEKKVADGIAAYTFAVTDNSDVKTGDTEAVEPEAIVSTTIKTPVAGKAVFNAKWSIPAGATINSVKVFRGTTKNYKTTITAEKIIAGNAVTNAKLFALNGDYTLNITGLDAARCLYAVIVIDYTIDGERETLTSTVNHIVPNGN